MSVLSDLDIHKEVGYGSLGIDPFDSDRVEPASYDVILDNDFIEYIGDEAVDLDEGISEDRILRYDWDEFMVPPNDIALGTTVATFDLPPNITASVEPKSSAARNGLVTDGWADPGFTGQITIELHNTTPRPLTVRAGSSYAQLVFERTEREASEPYDGRYQGQEGTQPSR